MGEHTQTCQVVKIMSDLKDLFLRPVCQECSLAEKGGLCVEKKPDLQALALGFVQSWPDQADSLCSQLGNVLP